MKIVGGPHDGMDFEIAPDRHDLALFNPRNERVIDWLCSECGRIATVELKQTIYTVRCLRSAGDEFSFLAPQDWSDMQALRHQFRK